VGLEEVLNSNVVLQDVVLVKKISAKEQKQREMAEDLANRQADHDHDHETSKPTKKMSKKKLRRQKKRDKRQKDLEESAARMGFLDDLEEVRVAREAAYLANLDEEDQEHEFAKTLENDPELAAELRAVEKELAEAYPEKGPEDTDEKSNDGKDTGDAETASGKS